MESNNYLYLGLGAVAVLVLFGVSTAIYSAASNTGNAEITIELSDESGKKTYSAIVDAEQMFSEEKIMLNFSPALPQSALQGRIKCEIRCNKEGS